MTLTQKTTHVEDAQANLISAYRHRPNTQAFVKSYAQQVKEIEAAAFQILNGTLDISSTGANLDVLGNLVGVARDGRTDTIYSVVIAAQILLNISSGTIEQIIAMVDAISGGGSAIQIVEIYPARFEVNALDILPPGVGLEVANILVDAKPAGVGGQFEYFETTPPFQLDTAGAGLDLGKLTGVVGL